MQFREDDILYVREYIKENDLLNEIKEKKKKKRESEMYNAERGNIIN